MSQPGTCGTILNNYKWVKLGSCGTILCNCKMTQAGRCGTILCSYKMSQPGSCGTILCNYKMSQPGSCGTILYNYKNESTWELWHNTLQLQNESTWELWHNTLQATKWVNLGAVAQYSTTTSESTWELWHNTLQLQRSQPGTCGTIFYNVQQFSAWALLWWTVISRDKCAEANVPAASVFGSAHSAHELRFIRGQQLIRTLFAYFEFVSTMHFCFLFSSPFVVKHISCESWARDNFITWQRRGSLVDTYWYYSQVCSSHLWGFFGLQQGCHLLWKTSLPRSVHCSDKEKRVTWQSTTE